MKNYRYGKFRFGDYCISWFAIALLLFFSISGIILNIYPVSIIFSIGYAAAWFCRILVPHFEQFVLCDNSITVFKRKKTRTIILPKELTLIVSYADICPPFAIRTINGNQTHVLKNKFAVTILHKTELEVVLEALHRNHMRNYTISRVDTVFDDYRYVYSFVCTLSQIYELTANRKHLLIIPESLLDVISIDLNIVNVHIDTGC